MNSGNHHQDYAVSLERLKWEFIIQRALLLSPGAAEEIGNGHLVDDSRLKSRARSVSHPSPCSPFCVYTACLYGVEHHVFSPSFRGNLQDGSIHFISLCLESVVTKFDSPFAAANGALKVLSWFFHFFQFGKVSKVPGNSNNVFSWFHVFQKTHCIKSDLLENL